MKASIIKCEDYNEQLVYNSVKKSVDLLGGIEKFVPKDAKVLLKPNMLMAKAPEAAATTHPAVLKAVINLVKTQTSNIFVGDSPGFGTAEKVGTVSGMKQVCEETGAKLIEFEEQEHYLNTDAHLVKHFTLAKIAKEADVVINLPKLKTHGMMVFTGAIKNLFGCIVGLNKPGWHLKLKDDHQFAQMIWDLHNQVKPKLNIMDGVIGMEGKGPNNGTPKKIGVIISSSDAYAVDKTACEIVNIKHDDCPINVVAAQDIKEQVGVVGENIDNVKIKDFDYTRHKNKMGFMPDFLKNIMKNSFSAKPVVIIPKCKACGNCIKVCPAKTIKMENNKAHIYHDKCIRCYCCHEMCPFDAIDLKKPLLLKLFKR